MRLRGWRGGCWGLAIRTGLFGSPRRQWPCSLALTSTHLTGSWAQTGWGLGTPGRQSPRSFPGRDLHPVSVSPHLCLPPRPTGPLPGTRRSRSRLCHPGRSRGRYTGSQHPRGTLWTPPRTQLCPEELTLHPLTPAALGNPAPPWGSQSQAAKQCCLSLSPRLGYEEQGWGPHPVP